MRAAREEGLLPYAHHDATQEEFSQGLMTRWIVSFSIDGSPFFKRAKQITITVLLGHGYRRKACRSCLDPLLPSLNIPFVGIQPHIVSMRCMRSTCLSRRRVLKDRVFTCMGRVNGSSGYKTKHPDLPFVYTLREV